MCDRLERVPRLCARMHKCGGGPCCPRTVKVSKCSGHPHCVARHLQGIVQEHQTLLDRIPHVKDLQCAWLLLLQCASARANYQLRPWIQPARNIMQIDRTQAQTMKDIASVPLVSGGLGLRSARWTRVPPIGQAGQMHTDARPHSE